MGAQTQNGKAFEFAVASAFSEILGGKLISNSSLFDAETNFSKVPAELKQRQMLAAKLGIEHLDSLGEFELLNLNQVQIRLSTDASGQKGDVRDVVVSDESRSLGVSCKNNHRAFKHSRLSATIDFVKKWNLDLEGASDEYWSAVLPVFQQLRSVKNTSQGTASWSDLENKNEVIYSPILTAFELEISRILHDMSSRGEQLSANLIDYVIGKQDFYKFILTNESLEIIGFNFHKTLNITRSKYPTRIHSIERDPDHPATTILRFQEGHTFSFRIHNASSKVEPSLKFDVQALALPSQHVYSHHINF